MPLQIIGLKLQGLAPRGRRTGGPTGSGQCRAASWKGRTARGRSRSSPARVRRPATATGTRASRTAQRPVRIEETDAVRCREHPGWMNQRTAADVSSPHLPRHLPRRHPARRIPAAYDPLQGAPPRISTSEPIAVLRRRGRRTGQRHCRQPPLASSIRWSRLASSVSRTCPAPRARARLRQPTRCRAGCERCASSELAHNLHSPLPGIRWSIIGLRTRFAERHRLKPRAVHPSGKDEILQHSIGSAL